MIKKIMEALDGIRDLPDEWDGPGTSKVSVHVIAMARLFTAVLEASGYRLPDRVAPAPDGDIIFGWIIEGAPMIEAEITDNTVYFVGDGEVYLEYPEILRLL